MTNVLPLFAASSAPRLTVIDGRLRYAGKLLLCHRPAGGCDSIPWPMPDPCPLDYWSSALWLTSLHKALRHARRTGNLPSDCRTVRLPDGSPFPIGGQS